MDSGDKPIDLTEPIFTHGEASRVSGVPSKSLHNWVQRGSIEIGKMHRAGRRLYSVFDLIELRIINELTTLVQMPIAYAAAAAGYARERAVKMSERDENGELIYPGQADAERQYLLIYFVNGEHKIKVEYGNDWFNQYSLPHSTIIVPLDDIVLRVENEAMDVLEAEEKE